MNKKILKKGLLSLAGATALVCSTAASAYLSSCASNSTTSSAIKDYAIEQIKAGFFSLTVNDAKLIEFSEQRLFGLGPNYFTVKTWLDQLDANSNQNGVWISKGQLGLDLAYKILDGSSAGSLDFGKLMFSVPQATFEQITIKPSSDTTRITVQVVVNVAGTLITSPQYESGSLFVDSKLQDDYDTTRNTLNTIGGIITKNIKSNSLAGTPDSVVPSTSIGVTYGGVYNKHVPVNDPNHDILGPGGGSDRKYNLSTNQTVSDWFSELYGLAATIVDYNGVAEQLGLSQLDGRNTAINLIQSSLLVQFIGGFKQNGNNNFEQLNLANVQMFPLSNTATNNPGVAEFILIAPIGPPSSKRFVFTKVLADGYLSEALNSVGNKVLEKVSQNPNATVKVNEYLPSEFLQQFIGASQFMPDVALEPSNLLKGRIFVPTLKGSGDQSYNTSSSFYNKFQEAFIGTNGLLKLPTFDEVGNIPAADQLKDSMPTFITPSPEQKPGSETPSFKGNFWIDWKAFNNGFYTEAGVRKPYFNDVEGTITLPLIYAFGVTDIGERLPIYDTSTKFAKRTITLTGFKTLKQMQDKIGASVAGGYFKQDMNSSQTLVNTKTLSQFSAENTDPSHSGVFTSGGLSTATSLIDKSLLTPEDIKYLQNTYQPFSNNNQAKFVANTEDDRLGDIWFNLIPKSYAQIDKIDSISDNSGVAGGQFVPELVNGSYNELSLIQSRLALSGFVGVGTTSDLDSITSILPNNPNQQAISDFKISAGNTFYDRWANNLDVGQFATNFMTPSFLTTNTVVEPGPGPGPGPGPEEPGPQPGLANLTLKSGTITQVSAKGGTDPDNLTAGRPFATFTLDTASGNNNLVVRSYSDLYETQKYFEVVLPNDPNAWISNFNELKISHGFTDGAKIKFEKTSGPGSVVFQDTPQGLLFKNTLPIDKTIYPTVRLTLVEGEKVSAPIEIKFVIYGRVSSGGPGGAAQFSVAANNIQSKVPGSYESVHISESKPVDKILNIFKSTLTNEQDVAKIAQLEKVLPFTAQNSILLNGTFDANGQTKIDEFNADKITAAGATPGLYQVQRYGNGLIQKAQNGFWGVSSTNLTNVPQLPTGTLTKEAPSIDGYGYFFSYKVTSPTTITIQCLALMPNGEFDKFEYTLGGFVGSTKEYLDEVIKAAVPAKNASVKSNFLNILTHLDTSEPSLSQGTNKSLADVNAVFDKAFEGAEPNVSGNLSVNFAPTNSATMPVANKGEFTLTRLPNSAVELTIPGTLITSLMGNGAIKDNTSINLGINQKVSTNWVDASNSTDPVLIARLRVAQALFSVFSWWPAGAASFENFVIALQRGIKEAKITFSVNNDQISANIGLQLVLFDGQISSIPGIRIDGFPGINGNNLQNLLNSSFVSANKNWIVNSAQAVLNSIIQNANQNLNTSLYTMGAITGSGTSKTTTLFSNDWRKLIQILSDPRTYGVKLSSTASRDIASFISSSIATSSLKVDGFTFDKAQNTWVKGQVGTETPIETFEQFTKYYEIINNPTELAKLEGLDKALRIANLSSYLVGNDANAVPAGTTQVFTATYNKDAPNASVTDPNSYNYAAIEAVNAPYLWGFNFSLNQQGNAVLFNIWFKVGISEVKKSVVIFQEK